jgi:hypothetical protein
MAAVAFGKGAGELGTQQEDLGRIVDPQQKHDQGAGRAVGRGNIALANIERDLIVATLEQDGCRQRADRYVLM